MKTGLTFAFVTVLVMALAASLSRLPEALARMDTFRVREIRVEGNRFLTREDALNTLGIPPSASVWDDLDAWEERLRSHSLVEDVEISRRLPGTLVMEVEETVPVALVPNPALEPVDASGRFLPIDPARHRLDLPLMALLDGGKMMTPSASERRLLAGEIARMAQQNPDLLSRVSEVILHSRGDVQARFWRRDPTRESWDSPVNLLFRPYLTAHRIQEGLRVLDDALLRFEGAGIVDLDLRYDDQVVVRLSRAQEG